MSTIEEGVLANGLVPISSATRRLRYVNGDEEQAIHN